MTTTMEENSHILQGSILLEQSKAKKFLLELRKIVDGQDCKEFLNEKEDFKELDLNGIVPELVKTLRQNGEVCEWLIKQVKNGKKEGLKVWNKIVTTLGKLLHHTGDGTAMLNSLLQVVEKAFKHDNSDMRIYAYQSWMVLMDNFALNLTMLSGPKRVNLLIKPLVGNLIHRKEEHIRVKFQAWWHFIGLLGPKIRQQVDSIIIPFLNFCFTASYGSSSPDSSPAKKYDSLRPLFLEATAILICGLNVVKVAKVDIKLVLNSLGNGLLTPSGFVTHQKAILECLKYMEECVDHNVKTDVEHFQNIYSSICSIVSEIARIQDFNQKKACQEAVGRFLQFSVDFCRLAGSTRPEIMPTAYSILTQLTKIPKEVMISTSIWSFDDNFGERSQTSPAQIFAKFLLNKPFVDHIYKVTLAPKNPIIPKQQQHLELFSKFVQMSSTVRLQGLDNLQDIIQIFILNQTMKKDDEEQHFQNMQDHIWNYWKIIAECYLNYVNMFDNVNQLFSKVMIKLDCSNLLMTFLIKSCLNGPPKIWKLWSEIMEKFNEKAPLLLKYQTLTLEEHIADQVLEKINHSDNEDLTGVQFNNLAVHICKTLTESLPMQNLSQESPTSMRFDPSSKVTKIIKVLVTLIEKLSSYNTGKDKKTSAHSLATQLSNVLSQTSNSSILGGLLKLISPSLGIMLRIMNAYDNKFEGLVKKIHEVAVNKIQAQYEGSYTQELLEDLKPFLLEALGHKKREIKTKTHQMWLLTFEVNLESDKIPNEIRELIKTQTSYQRSLSHSSSSEGFGAPASSFARPLTFGKYFNSKKDENNPSLENTNIVSSVSKSSPKPKTNTKKINIDEESSQDFVVIQSPSNNKKRVLTEHQKDLMRKRRDDIPALYSEISRDDSVSLANIPPVFDSQNLENSQNTVQEPVEKSQDNVQEEEEKNKTSANPKSTTGSDSTGTGIENTKMSNDEESSGQDFVELQSITNGDDITAKPTTSITEVQKDSIPVSEIDSENSSQGSESEPLSKSKRKGRKPTKFTSLKKFVKKKENKQTTKDSASVSALVNGENTSSKKRHDQKSNEESSSTTSGEVEVTANEETSQPKRKKRGRPAKNAKNDDEESENSQNLPPASAENSKNLPPAPADETSVVNDNKIQMKKQAYIGIQPMSPKHWKMALASPVKILNQSPLMLEPSPISTPKPEDRHLNNLHNKNEKVSSAKKVISFDSIEEEPKEPKENIQTAVNGEKNNVADVDKLPISNDQLPVDQVPVPVEDTEELIESSQSQELDNSSKRRSRRRVSNSSKNNITSNLDDPCSGTEPKSKTFDEPKNNKKTKVNKFGETPLHLAAKHGKFDQVKELIDEGVLDINAKDHAGWTPLHEAAQYDGEKGQEVLEYLVANGADVNAKGLDGATPLHDAVSHGTDKYVVHLIKHGADPEIRNDLEKSPIDIASNSMKSLIEKCQQKSSSIDEDKMDVDDDDLTEKEVQSITETEPEDILESDHDELNDSSNSVLATPLDNSIDEENVVSIPSSLDQDQPQKVCEDQPQPEVQQQPSQNIEEIPSNNPPAAAPQIMITETTSPSEEKENSQSLIKPPLPCLKKAKALNSVFNSRGARLLEMSKNKGAAGSPSSTTITLSSSPSSSSLMSPRLEGLHDEVNGTPKQPEKKQPWQKFEPSPRCESPGILKRSHSSASLDETASSGSTTSGQDQQQPANKKRKVQFTDPPVSEEVVIPRCPSGKATRRKVLNYRFNKDLFLGPVKKNLSKPNGNGATSGSGSDGIEETEMEASAGGSSGLYQATPPLQGGQNLHDNEGHHQNQPGAVNPNCLYPALVECDEPISSIMNNLTTKTWHKAAEKSLTENNLATIGDLSRLSSLKAGMIKSLKPPNNVATIREALRKFEKIWIKRNNKATTPGSETKAKVSETATAADLLDVDFTENLENNQSKEQSPTAAPVVDIQSTPEEEDETMKELYERPSPSPPAEIDQDQLPVQAEQLPAPSDESNSLDHVENVDEVVPDGQRLELSTSSTNDSDLTEKEVQNVTEMEQKALSENKDIGHATSNDASEMETDDDDTTAATPLLPVQPETSIPTGIEDTPTTKISVVTVETNTENIPKAETSAQCSVDTSDASNNTPEKEMKNVDAQTCEDELVDKNQIIDEMLTKMEKFNSSDLSRVLTKVADLMKKL